MLAEIKHKASHTLEDQLTGDFFVTIRYLPFEKGLVHVLSAVRFNNSLVQQEWLSALQKETIILYRDIEINFKVQKKKGALRLS